MEKKHTQAILDEDEQRFRDGVSLQLALNDLDDAQSLVTYLENAVKYGRCQYCNNPLQHDEKGMCTYCSQSFLDEKQQKLSDAIDFLTSELPMDLVNRVEVIDETGRVYAKYCTPGDVCVSFQDEWKTLKIFITK